MKKYQYYLSLVVALTFVVFFPTLQNGWTNLDDTIYITENPLIRNLSWDHIKRIFSTYQVNGSYNPLVLISWAIDYQFAGLSPEFYHANNLFFHIVVTILVYFFITKLSKNKVIALFTSLLFGIHPMHVEAVAWITARKDLLYAVFFMAGLISYLYYVEKKVKRDKILFITCCFLFFLMALLSKAVAVTFPVVLLLIDYLKQRSNVKEVLFEKVPFLVLSLFFIYHSIQAQERGGALQFREFYSVLDSLSVGFYGYLVYLLKFFIPYKLSALHPYPTPSGTPNPYYFWFAAIPILLIVLFCIYKFKKYRNVVFGLGFFFITLVPVIQVLSFAVSVTADRFTYIPYLGLCFAFVKIVYSVVQQQPQCTVISIVISSIYIVVMGRVAFSYTKVWKNSETVWTRIIKYYPDYFISYVNRGAYRIDQKQYDKATSDCKKALQLNPHYYLAYYNLGFICEKKKEDLRALQYYSEAIQYKEDAFQVYQNRGILLGKLGRYEEALMDFNKSIELKPNSATAYLNRATHYNQLDHCREAIIDVDKAIFFNKYLSQAYFIKGMCLYKMTKKEQALNYFNRALALDPNLADAYTQKGNLYYNSKKYEQASNLYNKAIFFDKDQFEAHINLGIILMNSAKFEVALIHFSEAQRIDSDNYLVYLNRGLGYKLNGNIPKAIEDLETCLRIRPNHKLAFDELQLLKSKLNNKLN